MKELLLNKNCLIMGVVNITPDSFSDGGDFLDPNDAYSQAALLDEQGADVVDLGAESSRPGATPLTDQEEWDRLEPLLLKLRQRPLRAKISLDTYKTQTMLRSLDFGIDIINDIKGGADQAVLKKLAAAGVGYCAMHMHRNPELMQVSPLEPEQALREVGDFYQKTYSHLKNCGFSDDKIWLDPGIGFGKTDTANLQLIQQATEMASQYPIAIGISRKSFMGRLLGIQSPLDRDGPSKMLEFSLMHSGIGMIRTHDVASLAKIKKIYVGSGIGKYLETSSSIGGV